LGLPQSRALRWLQRWFHRLLMTAKRQDFVILSAAKNPRKWILRLRLRMTRLTAHRLFKSRAIKAERTRQRQKQKKQSPKKSQTKRAKNEIYTQKKDKL